LLLACGSAGSNNSTGVNATHAGDLNATFENATQNVVDTTAIPTTNVSVDNQTANATAADVSMVNTVPTPDTSYQIIRSQNVFLPPVNQVLEQQFVDRNIMRMRNITAADRQAAADRAAAAGLHVATAGSGAPVIVALSAPVPGGTPDYFGPYPNYANSPPIRKFVDSLPGLGVSGANNLGHYIPVAVADTGIYPGSDYYEIALVQYSEQLHSDLPPTTLRGYVQLVTPNNTGICSHVALTYPNTSPIRDSTGAQVYACGNPQYLGPMIIAQKNRPVRVKFHNYLATGTDGNLFIPVDTTIMGAGMGPDGVNSYSQNRATLHLHGGNTPWISDGTPDQWTTPAGENTAYPEGVSVKNVPDMDNGIEPQGTLTFFYTNQQSARLLFYHDHALGITRLNVYAGEAAGYIVRDPVEQLLISTHVIPSDEIPLIIQDRTFVDATNISKQDPTWNWGTTPPTPHTGDLWFPHVYIPNQNPWDLSGTNAMGRWDYGPWFWPPFTGLLNGPLPNPYTGPGEPPQIPGTPNPSIVPEGFMDTPLVNGNAYPYLQVGAKAYRFRILNACNDRYLNLQLYFAKSNDTMWSGTTLLNGSSGEVNMVPAIPVVNRSPFWPTDGRDGGVPDPNSTGPSWIQIGSEGGFLPAPVVVPPQPVSYDYNRRIITVLDVLNTSLYLGPAERADVIVDFSGIPDGTKLILYNDAPAPNPGFDPRNDYYTGDPDQTSMGGANTTLPGYGPNTRTIMQIQVKTSLGNAAPYNFNLLNTTLPNAYSQVQDKPIVPQAAYNTAFGTNYPVDAYARIQDYFMNFTAADSTPVNMEMKPKSIIEDFDVSYGRMNAMLGVEVPRTTINTQTSIPYYYIDPPTEIFNNSVVGTPLGTMADGTQIWKITHNGVDTHAIHFHMFNVQVINRVGWDGQVKPPFAYELGWKDTVKMRPLEDVIVAMRPIKPTIPWDIPNSIRPLDVTQPLGTAMTLQFHNIDPTNEPATVTNHLVNYGWEYVWHCHLLGHEELDMMRPMALAVAPSQAPSSLIAGLVTTPTVPIINLAWKDTTVSETNWTIQRATNPAGPWTDIAMIPSTTGPQTGGWAMYNDTTAVLPGSQYYYRVLATNVVGDFTTYALPATGYPSIAVNSTPSLTDVPHHVNPPVANFNGVPVSGAAPLKVVFTDSSTGLPTAWSWNFGDGNVTNSTAQNPVHTYLYPGNFTVSLKAINVGGSNTRIRIGYINVTATQVPTITGLTPTSGSISGGTTVTISGSGFAGASRVDFGTYPAGMLTVTNTQITVTSPGQLSAGMVNVRVTTPSGVSAIVPADQFTYV
ncbi:MAG: IPT/TIG domain-containing protein, partial [Methanoregula sp.]